MQTFLGAIIAVVALASIPGSGAKAAVLPTDLVVTNDLVLSPSMFSVRLIVRSSHVTIDGRGLTLNGPGRAGDLASLEAAGIGVLVEDAEGVVIKNLKIKGFATGLVLRRVTAALIEDCDFSDNYDNPAHGWGELPARGGILCDHVRLSTFRHNHSNRVWDGMHLIDSDDNLVQENDFSHCSNTAAKLWRASRNKFLRNNLSYGIRIDRAAGEVHARDSTCVLIETGSNANEWYQNDITHGGDGIFIRPLNRWISTGNIFVENDTSYANNNCVESWSPGNTFIRNRANYGSYGFWLGGSDATVLIGNEAAFNGLTNGNHNAPEPGFHHGGIVFVSGSSSHSRVEGNDVHDNNGGGIVFRGDEGSQGKQWRSEHWVVQQNRVYNNRFGLWGRWGAAITVGANIITNNALGDFLSNVDGLVQLAGSPEIRTPPSAQLNGPSTAKVGESVRFDASDSRDFAGRPLSFHWWVDGETGHDQAFERRFEHPGLARICLTVENGTLASLAWRDLMIVQPPQHELGTEGDASEWGYELEMNGDGHGRITFADDAQALIGQRCLRFTPDPYPGAYATVIFPKARNADWDFSAKKHVTFWLKTLNPNLPGYQNAGPVIRLLGRDGQLELKPVKDGNLLNDPPFSEARWGWAPFVIPLTGDNQWQRTVTGKLDLGKVEAISVSLDSWGGDPFTVWLDGLAVE